MWNINQFDLHIDFFYFNKKLHIDQHIECPVFHEFLINNGEAISLTITIVTHPNFTLCQSMTHRWKARSLSCTAVPTTPMMPFIKYSTIWLCQSSIIKRILSFHKRRNQICLGTCRGSSSDTTANKIMPWVQ